MVFLAAILVIITSLLLLFVLVGFFFFIFDLFLELPYVGTRRETIKTIMDLASIKEGQTVVDLGSGDGRLLLSAASKGAFAIGYEINPFLIAMSLIHAKLKGLSDRLSIYKKNLWHADLKVADVVFVFAKRKSMPKFEKFIFENCQKGTKIVVNMNPFPNKKPARSQNGVYLYKV